MEIHKRRGSRVQRHVSFMNYCADGYDIEDLWKLVSPRTSREGFMEVCVTNPVVTYIRIKVEANVSRIMDEDVRYRYLTGKRKDNVRNRLHEKMIDGVFDRCCRDSYINIRNAVFRKAVLRIIDDIREPKIFRRKS